MKMDSGKEEQFFSSLPIASREGFEPPTDCLAYHYSLRCQKDISFTSVCGLDHIFTVSGGVRMASTEPCDNHWQNVRSCVDYSSVYLPSTMLISATPNQLEPLIYLCRRLYLVYDAS